MIPACGRQEGEKELRSDNVGTLPSVIGMVIGVWRYHMVEEKKSFGDFLVGLGVLTADQIKKALQEQKQRGERLEQTIVRLGYAKEELILQCLADYFNLPYVDLDTYLIDEKIVKTHPGRDGAASYT